MVSTHHSCTKSRQREMLSNKFLSSQQSNKKVHLAHALSRRYFLSAKQCKIFLHIGPSSRIPPYSLDEASIPKTAFTSSYGKYEYIKVPFRLTQAPAYFQELMTGILKDFNFAIAYLDVIIFSKTAEGHLDHIKQVFEKLRSEHLSMKLSKCHFFMKEI